MFNGDFKIMNFNKIFQALNLKRSYKTATIPIFMRIFFSACGILIFLSACTRQPLYRQESFVFGTRVEILIAGADAEKARLAASAVLAEFDRLHQTYHAWRPSQLSSLNSALAAGKTSPLSPEMADLIRSAQAFSQASGALFDPAIGGLIQLWGFQSDEFSAKLPDPKALAAWRSAAPKMSDLSIKNDQISSTNKALALDFGGYLKGVALDRAATILRQHQIYNALVNIGGNVIALGHKNAEAWRVGIQDPRKPAPLATLALNDGEAIGTSGDYQRFFELDGKRYAHLLDPRSGEPVTHTQALTVLISPRANAGMLSDVASKPLFIVGEAWPKLAQKMGIENVLRVDSEGKIEVSAKLLPRLSWTNEKPAQLKIR